MSEATLPAERLGHAKIDPPGTFEAGSWAAFTLTYTAGFYGIDDSGSLAIVFRFPTDQTPPQFEDPAGPGYTTVEASNAATLACRYDAKGNLRPWDKTVQVKVVKGFLRAGDTITVRLGDRRFGSPGMRLQTFCEDTFEFRVLVDPVATCNFQPVAPQPVIRIGPGPAAAWRAVLPSMVGCGEAFRLRVKTEDRWGNPTDRGVRRARLVAHGPGPVHGLPEMVAIEHGRFSGESPDLTISAAGDYLLRLIDDRGAELAVSSPLRAVAGPSARLYWGDLHGQTEETIGTNSAHAYFAFARDRAFLDVAAHQGNDFQITETFWQELNRLTAAFNEPGRFVTLPGYEWSGNTGLGGDRNVYFATEGRPIRRSSHALVPDARDLATDCPTARELFDALTRDGEDVVCVAHCGGRYADLAAAHDGCIERAIEIHSSWGTFEWLLHDALKLGHRVGVVANSDGHKGRPGASYPGAAHFGAIGGLTGYWIHRLERASIVECLRRRRHFATTGTRLLLDVTVRFDGDAQVYHDDPALQPAEARSARGAVMGDIVHLPDGEAELRVDVSAGTPILRIDLLNGLGLVESVPGYEPGTLGNRIRAVWQGAEYRGRARETVWDGTATLSGNRIRDARQFNFFNPDRRFERQGETGLAWQALTTGNFGGFDLWLADAAAGTIAIATPLVTETVRIADIGFCETRFDAGGLGRALSLFRLPETLERRTMTLTRPLTLAPQGDNPVYVRVTLEDGHVAWSSPIYIFRSPA
ncbi:MAG: DUF3604 domain-containing protein [Geminicoccaceae bacterium]